MPAALIAVVTFLLLTTTGLAVAASARLRTPAELIVGAFVVAFAEIVALTLTLSPFGAIRRPALLLGMAAIWALAIGIWWRRGRPGRDGDALRSAGAQLLRHAPLAALALVVVMAFGYVLALIVATAPNAWDTMTYHLARAAFWRQEGGAGYISDAYDGRLNGNPPNAELALTFVLELTRDERYAGFVQLFAAVALAAGIFALARRLGLPCGEAAFGSLLFLTLPVVLLQSSTALNDLVLAALLLAATVVVLGESRAPLALAALATALAVGTKLTALYGLPILLLVLLVAPPRSMRVSRLVALAVGAIAGSYWYVVNLVETGRILGRQPGTELIALFEPRENLLSAFARVLDTFDLSGAENAHRFVLPTLLDSDLLAYVAAAVLLAAALLVAALVTRRSTPRLAFTAGALALLPLAVAPLGYALWRVFAKLHDLLGGPAGRLPVGEWPSQTTASETISWFGPLALFLLTAVAIASVVLYRRGSWSAPAVVAATAPLAWLVLLSLSVEYDTWQGRFFIFPVALSASLWGIALRSPTVAWAAVAVGATTVFLSLVNSLEKPAGIRLFSEREIGSIWKKNRWEAQSFQRPELTEVLRFLEERLPHDASIALALGEDDFAYPAFGADLARRVELVPEDSRGQDLMVEWLLANPDRARQIDRACWQAVAETPRGWTVFQAQAGCPP
jgi:hypothetical protein